MKIAFDIGGVLSKHPDKFREFINQSSFEVFIITDMHDKNEVEEMLKMNDFDIPSDHIYCADYANYGEMCKAILLKKLDIDMFFDDFIGYTQWDSSLGESPIRFLMMPDPWQPYWHSDWKVKDNFDFGRRKFSKK